MRIRGATFSLLLCLSACRAPEEGLRIGAKDFPEQLVLSELVAQLIERRGEGRPDIENCGDTHGCQRQIFSGRIDLMVEYTGSALSYQGEPRIDRWQSIRQLQKRQKEQGLRWFEPLGFDNGHQVAALTHRATTLGIKTIADLANVPNGVRISCPPNYLARSQDDLVSLVQRHGLRLRGKPLLLKRATERHHALVTDRADVAIVFGTDGSMRDLSVTILEDSLGFFPPYQAAVVARRAALDRYPGLEHTLAQLSGRLDGSTMRQANYEAQVEGKPPSAVARALMRRLGLSTQAPVGRRLLPAIRLALAVGDHLEMNTGPATRALHRIFPDRTVEVDRVEDPIEAIAAGKADVGVVGGERLFDMESGKLGQRETRVEALAALGQRVIHLLRQRKDAKGTRPLSGRIAVEHSRNAGGRLAAKLLGLGGIAIHTTGSRSRLISALRKKTIDGAVLFGEPGCSEVARAMADGGLKLVALPNLESRRLFPQLRPQRLAARTYRHQKGPLETLGMQVLLVGPARAARGVGGPVAADPNRGRPFTETEIRGLLEATRSFGRPDPILPLAPSLRPEGATGKLRPVQHRKLDLFMNLAAIAFIFWLGWTVFRAD